MRIAIVDENDRFLRWEDRIRAHELRLVHRSIHMLVFDGQGRLLIQQRAASKQTWPLYWDSSVAGHVEEPDYPAGPDEGLDRIYRDVAARELKEELGVEAALTELAHLTPTPGVHYEQARLFEAVSDGPFVAQESEVAALRLVTPTEFDQMVAEGAPLTSMLRYLVGWLRERGRFERT